MTSCCFSQYFDSLTFGKKSLEKGLLVLSRTPLGKRLLNDLTQMNEHLPTSFVPMDYSLFRLLRHPDQPGCPVGASFIADSAGGKIYFNAAEHIEVLSLQLAHELSHATDPALRNAFFNTSANRALIQQDSEIRAFQDQDKFLSELENLFPGVRRKIQTLYPRATYLYQPFEAQQVRALRPGNPS